MRRSFSMFALAAWLLTSACGSDTTYPSQPQNQTMSARIDGTAWNAVSISVAPAEPSALLIQGTNPTESVALFIPLGAGDGTQTIGGPTPLAAILTAGSQAWSASRTQGGSGSVTLTSTTGGRIAGTFEFTLAASDGASPGTRRVTSGAFDVSY